MKVEVTIELNDSEMKVLSDWASVSRTLNFSKTLLTKCILEHQTETVGTLDGLNMNLDELEQIEPILNSIHNQIRGQVWEINRVEKDRVDSLRREDTLK